jgi:hypothetical protein
VRPKLPVAIGVALLVTAVSPAVPAVAVPTAIEVSPLALDFGSVPVGTTAPAKAVQVMNTGPSPFGPINIFGGAPPTADFNASQNCQGVTLPAGGSCQISYTFTPGAAGKVGDLSSFTISPTSSQSDGEDFSVTLAGCGSCPEPVPPVDVGRQVTLKLKGSLTAKGRVRTDGAQPGCFSGVTVSVQRRRDKKWRTVDTTMTNGTGHYRESLSARPGKYRALVEQVVLPSGATCLRDVSRVKQP